MHSRNKHSDDEYDERKRESHKKGENVKHLMTRFACLLNSIDILS